MDRMSCHGIPCPVEIGFKESEQGIKQLLLVDFEVEFEAIQSDDQNAIRVDYFEACQQIKNFLAEKKISLIETVGSQIAELLLKNFQVAKAKVWVHKNPHGMEEVQDVVFECERP